MATITPLSSNSPFFSLTRWRICKLIHFILPIKIIHFSINNYIIHLRDLTDSHYYPIVFSPSSLALRFIRETESFSSISLLWKRSHTMASSIDLSTVFGVLGNIFSCLRTYKMHACTVTNMIIFSREYFLLFRLSCLNVNAVNSFYVPLDFWIRH